MEEGSKPWFKTLDWGYMKMTYNTFEEANPCLSKTPIVAFVVTQETTGDGRPFLRWLWWTDEKDDPKQILVKGTTHFYTKEVKEITGGQTMEIPRLAGTFAVHEKSTKYLKIFELNE